MKVPTVKMPVVVYGLLPAQIIFVDSTMKLYKTHERDTCRQIQINQASKSNNKLHRQSTNRHKQKSCILPPSSGGTFTLSTLTNLFINQNKTPTNCLVGVFLLTVLAHHFYINVHAGRQRKVRKSLYYFRTRVENIDHTLVCSHFKLFSRVLVYES